MIQIHQEYLNIIKYQENLYKINPSFPNSNCINQKLSKIQATNKLNKYTHKCK
jgi:hypothetical protein